MISVTQEGSVDFKRMDRSLDNLNKNLKFNVHPVLTGATHLCLGKTFISVGDPTVK